MGKTASHSRQGNSPFIFISRSTAENGSSSSFLYSSSAFVTSRSRPANKLLAGRPLEFAAAAAAASAAAFARCSMLGTSASSLPAPASAA